MKVVALANAKGGTGKTSISVHLAVGAALAGHRALLVDLDPQGNATEWLTGLDRHATGVADALARGELQEGEIVEVPNRPGLDIAPASLAGGTLDAALARVGGQEVLGDLLRPLRSRYELVVIDCPGSLGMAVAGAITAANAVIVPVTPPFFSLRGVQQLEAGVARARRHWGARADDIFHVLFAADPRKAITAQTREILRAQGRLLAAEIRVSAAAEGMASHQQTAWDSGTDSRGAEDYQPLLAEVMERIGMRPAAGARRRRPKQQ